MTSGCEAIIAPLSVCIPAQRGDGSQAPPLTEAQWTADGLWGLESQFSLRMCPLPKWPLLQCVVPHPRVYRKQEWGTVGYRKKRREEEKKGVMNLGRVGGRNERERIITHCVKIFFKN